MIQDGSGYGGENGSGAGCSCGADDGYGRGYGNGDIASGDLLEINGNPVELIDGIPTVIYSTHGAVSRGAILGDDMTLPDCYIARSDDLTAHGETLRKAVDALTDKAVGGLPESERIAQFVLQFPEYRKPYPNRDLYQWHHRLTGSCAMGRDKFVAESGIDLEGETTVEEFVRLTQGYFGGAIIKKITGCYR